MKRIKKASDANAAAAEQAMASVARVLTTGPEKIPDSTAGENETIVDMDRTKRVAELDHPHAGGEAVAPTSSVAAADERKIELKRIAIQKNSPNDDDVDGGGDDEEEERLDLEDDTNHSHSHHPHHQARFASSSSRDQHPQQQQRPRQTREAPSWQNQQYMNAPIHRPRCSLLSVLVTVLQFVFLILLLILCSILVDRSSDHSADDESLRLLRDMQQRNAWAAELSMPALFDSTMGTWTALLFSRTSLTCNYIQRRLVKDELVTRRAGWQWTAQNQAFATLKGNMLSSLPNTSGLGNDNDNNNNNNNTPDSWNSLVYAMYLVSPCTCSIICPCAPATAPADLDSRIQTWRLALQAETGVWIAGLQMRVDTLVQRKAEEWTTCLSSLPTLASTVTSARRNMEGDRAKLELATQGQKCMNLAQQFGDLLDQTWLDSQGHL